MVMVTLRKGSIFYLKALQTSDGTVSVIQYHKYKCQMQIQIHKYKYVAFMNGGGTVSQIQAVSPLTGPLQSPCKKPLSLSKVLP